MLNSRIRKFAVPVRGKGVEVVPVHALKIHGSVRGIAPLARQPNSIPRILRSYDRVS